MRNKPNETTTGLIYLVCSPIGNLKDFTFRAVEVLKSCDLIYCEDTRNTAFLLESYGIDYKGKLYSLYSQTEVSNSLSIVKNVKDNNLVCCYLSDAGCPGISDPGSILIKTAIENDVNVSILPGATASVSALVMSGFDTSNFTFRGFISPKEQAATKYLADHLYDTSVSIYYETSKRILDFLKYLKNAGYGERNICICKELTKIHEEYIRGTVNELLDSDLSFIKGELVIIVDKCKEEKEDTEKLKEIISMLKKEDVSNKTILKILQKYFDVNKNILYKLILDDEE